MTLRDQLRVRPAFYRDRRAWGISGLVVMLALFAACTYVGLTT